MTGRARESILACLIAASVAAGATLPARSDICTFPTAVKVDVAIADTTVFPFYCRGYGQVFMATDTLIESISVWRPADTTVDAVQRHLFVTGTFAEDDRVPDVNQLL